MKTMTFRQLKRLLREAVEVKDAKLESILNALLADEFIAWEQYKMIHMAAKGKALEHFLDVCKDNGFEELTDHFDRLVTWMQSVGMKTVNDPDKYTEIANCPFTKVSPEQDSESLVDIAISAEEKAIEAYEAVLAMDVIKSNPDLVQLLSDFLGDERKHHKELLDVKSEITGYTGEMINPGNEIQVSDDDEANDEEDKPIKESRHRRFRKASR